MPLNYRKRVSLGNGVGLNVSQSGVSTSLRTRQGSIGSRGFSIRTGIPGLSFRGTLGRAKGNEAVFILMAFLVLGTVVIIGLLIWNLIRFSAWLLRVAYDRMRRKTVATEALDAPLGRIRNEPKEFVFGEESIPPSMRSMPITLKTLLVREGDYIEIGESVAEIEVAGITGSLPSTASGTISFYKSVGDRINLGDKIFTVA